MRCIVGLGNPGPEYADTRHNAGAAAVELLAHRHSIPLARRRHQALFGRGQIAGVEVLLAQPLTFMNNSGQAVRRLLSFHGLSTDHLLVVVDDINLALGTTRIRRRGSDGGQKGLRSVAQHVGTTEYARLRIGVGPLPPGRDATAFVLSPFRPSERDAAVAGIERAADAIERALADGLEVAMDQFNG